MGSLTTLTQLQFFKLIFNFDLSSRRWNDNQAFIIIKSNNNFSFFVEAEVQHLVSLKLFKTIFVKKLDEDKNLLTIVLNEAQVSTVQELLKRMKINWGLDDEKVIYEKAKIFRKKNKNKFEKTIKDKEKKKVDQIKIGEEKIQIASAENEEDYEWVKKQEGEVIVSVFWDNKRGYLYSTNFLEKNFEKKNKKITVTAKSFVSLSRVGVGAIHPLKFNKKPWRYESRIPICLECVSIVPVEFNIEKLEKYKNKKTEQIIKHAERKIKNDRSSVVVYLQDKLNFGVLVPLEIVIQYDLTHLIIGFPLISLEHASFHQTQLSVPCFTDISLFSSFATQFCKSFLPLPVDDFHFFLKNYLLREYSSTNFNSIEKQVQSNPQETEYLLQIHNASIQFILSQCKALLGEKEGVGEHVDLFPIIQKLIQSLSCQFTRYLHHLTVLHSSSLSNSLLQQNVQQKIGENIFAIEKLSLKLENSSAKRSALLAANSAFRNENRLLSSKYESLQLAFNDLHSKYTSLLSSSSLLSSPSPLLPSPSPPLLPSSSSFSLPSLQPSSSLSSQPSSLPQPAPTVHTAEQEGKPLSILNQANLVPRNPEQLVGFPFSLEEKEAQSANQNEEHTSNIHPLQGAQEPKIPDQSTNILLVDQSTIISHLDQSTNTQQQATELVNVDHTKIESKHGNQLAVNSPEQEVLPSQNVQESNVIQNAECSDSVKKEEQKVKEDGGKEGGKEKEKEDGGKEEGKEKEKEEEVKGKEKQEEIHEEYPKEPEKKEESEIKDEKEGNKGERELPQPEQVENKEIKEVEEENREINLLEATVEGGDANPKKEDIQQPTSKEEIPNPNTTIDQSSNVAEKNISKQSNTEEGTRRDADLPLQEEKLEEGKEGDEDVKEESEKKQEKEEREKENKKEGGWDSREEEEKKGSGSGWESQEEKRGSGSDYSSYDERKRERGGSDSGYGRGRGRGGSEDSQEERRIILSSGGEEKNKRARRNRGKQQFNLKTWLGQYISEEFQLDSIKKLNLSKISLEKIPKEIGQLTQLQELDFSSNKIQEIPPIFDNLLHLECLLFTENEIEEIPEQISSLTNLVKLDFSLNELKEVDLPDNIGELKKLIHVDFSSNEIAELSENLFNLVNLQYLNVSKNQLEELPNEIGKLNKLKELRLAENELEELPKHFSKLNKLTLLDLASNQIHDIPESITDIVSLTYLNLSYNEIEKVPPQLSKLKNLKELHLNNNEITKLPQQLQNLSTLKLFNVAKNPLNSMELRRLKVQMTCEMVIE